MVEFGFFLFWFGGFYVYFYKVFGDFLVFLFVWVSVVVIGFVV